MRILNLGSINIDYVYNVPHFVKAGETLASSTRQIFPGGKGMNQSIALARAGADCSHAGMIGVDGAYLLDIFRNAGVNVDLIVQQDEPTGHTVIQVTPSGENCILLYGGANQKINKDMADTALKSFGQGDLLLLQNEISCVGYAMEAANKKKLDIAFNPSPITAEIGKYPLDLVNWWLLNEVEGQALTGKEAADDILEEMGKMYSHAVIVLTLGTDGVICKYKDDVYKYGIYKVQAVDTTAAGDTFTGYFIAEIARQIPIPEALMIASKAASVTVSRQGAAVSIPLRSEIVV